MFLAAMVNDTTQVSPAIEIDILDPNRQVIFQTRVTRDSPYLMDAVSIDNYLFLTYTDATGLKMDVMYWGVSTQLAVQPVQHVANVSCF